jgi:hypothetical protein
MGRITRPTTWRCSRRVCPNAKLSPGNTNSWRWWRRPCDEAAKTQQNASVVRICVRSLLQDSKTCSEDVVSCCSNDRQTICQVTPTLGVGLKILQGAAKFSPTSHARLGPMIVQVLRKEILAALADKWGRTHQTIKQFSARNSAEVASRRQVLLGEVDAEAAHLWVSDKTRRIACLQKWIEDLDTRLADEELDLRVRSRLTRDAAQLLRSVAEEKGELRSIVEVDSGPVLTRIVEGWNPTAWLQRLGTEESSAPEPPVAPDGSDSSAPAPFRDRILWTRLARQSVGLRCGSFPDLVS